MAQNKTSQILEILESNENVTQREIAKRVSCTEGYVSRIKNEHLKAKETPPDETINDPSDEEFEAEISNFIKKVKITPPPETLTENTGEPDTDEEYECGDCGHTWTGNRAEVQKECPGCGVELG